MALGPTRSRVDLARPEEPSTTGGSLMLGIGWIWRGAFLEAGATVDRAAVIDGDPDLPVESYSQIEVGAALGYRPGYGLEAAATAARTRVILRYDDDDWDFERDGWALGLRGGKTWPLAGGPWLLGFELLADLAFFERAPVEPERPLVWTYRLRLVFAR